MALESTGVEGVREALKRYAAVGLQSDAVIGPAPMTKGYAVDWLAWRDGDKAKRDDRSRTWQTFWMAVAALATLGAAVVAYLTFRTPGPH
jgi:hypothetical protein